MAAHLGWPRHKIASRVDELRELTRLSPEVLARYPAEMSGGQRQRVALVRALMLDADVLLLDEPLGSLDPIVRAELQQELAKIFRRLRKTVALITHDLAEAAFFADRIVLSAITAELSKPARSASCRTARPMILSASLCGHSN